MSILINAKLHTDPGHGWLAIKRSVLAELNLLDKVSNCSYQSKSGKTVYLEEDSDMSLFLNQAKTLGIQVEYKDSYKERSPIRSYPRFQK